MELLNTRCDNLTFTEALDGASALLERSERSDIFFLNIDCLRLASQDAEYRGILAASSMVLPDGIGLKFAARVLGLRLKDNCNGTDFCPALMRRAASLGRSVFLLGAGDGVAQGAAENLRKMAPGLRIAGTESGYFESDAAVIERINRSKADMLLVAMGAPLQEKWIAKNRQRLRVPMCLGVGALLDFWSGRVRRAPGPLRALKLEWLWRAGLEPSRLGRRYAADAGFLWTLLTRRGRG